MPEPTTLWGIVNGATYASDLATAINQAQSDGYKTVYIPASNTPYQLDYTKIIHINTDNFTLVGAGANSTIIEFSQTCDSTCQCGIVVGKTSGQIQGVRLADFTVQMSTTTGGTPYRLGGIYLKDCRGVMVERVNAKNWNWNNTQAPGYGFQAINNGAGGNKPAGGIVFYQCGCESTFYGIWLTGSSTYPMQRCSIINPYFNALDPNAQPQVVTNSYGIYIQRAKGTLVFGGKFANYQYGVCIDSPTENETWQSQIFGAKFDTVTRGVWIASGSEKTQVLGATRSSDIDQVEDYGANNLLVTHNVNLNPDTQKYQPDDLVLTQQHRSQFNEDANIFGTLDAAQLGGAGAGIRTYKVEGYGLSSSQFNTSYGNDTLNGFVGVYYNTQDQYHYLVAKSKDVWNYVKLYTI